MIARPLSAGVPGMAADAMPWEGHMNAMGTARLEAFTDGVLAIAITIMVLELRIPAGGDLASLPDRHLSCSPTS